MLVRNWMTTECVQLGLNTPVVEVKETMRRNSLRHLPVIDDRGHLVGIISDGDVRDAMPSKYLDYESRGRGKSLADLRARDIMTEDPTVVAEDASMETAAELLQEYGVGSLPVVKEDNALTGMLADRDVFRYLCTVTGLEQGGIQLVFEVNNTPGQALELVLCLKDLGIRLTSVLTSCERIKPHILQVAVRVKMLCGTHPTEVLDRLKKFPLIYAVAEGAMVHPERIEGACPA